MYLRNVCFTLNNYIEQDITALNEIYETYMSYLIVGREVGEQGTPHLQGYFELKKQQRFETLKKRLPRYHLEARKGTAEQAIKYCKKECNFIERGAPKGTMRHIEKPGKERTWRDDHPNLLTTDKDPSFTVLCYLQYQARKLDWSIERMAKYWTCSEDTIKRALEPTPTWPNGDVSDVSACVTTQKGNTNKSIWDLAALESF